MPNFTLEGHDKGVNCVDYFAGGDRPYLISGADDKLVKIWDYQTKSCVQTLEARARPIPQHSRAVTYHYLNPYPIRSCAGPCWPDLAGAP